MISEQILDIVFQYSLNKFDDTPQQLAAGRAKFLKVISEFVKAGKPIEMCLPAFPFKSANKVYKVLGDLPDKAEELALERLNTMCVHIKYIYPSGAQCTIISDGITYNDLLSISDKETWQYGEALRAMAHQHDFHHIKFSRIKDLIQFPGLPDQLREISYVANAFNFRRHMFNQYGDDNIDIDTEIATNPDTKLTYLGYLRFLESDMQYMFPTGNGRTRNGYKRDIKYLAKQMLIRGYAFAGAVRNAFPNHLRLSIHQSVGGHKVSMSLLNTKTGFTTPWHCAVALLAHGEWISAPAGDFRSNPKMEVVYENGRPSYYREVSDNAVEDFQNGVNTAGFEMALNLVSKHADRLAAGSEVAVIKPIVDGVAKTPRSDLSSRCSGHSNNNDTSSSTSYGKRLIPHIADRLAISDPDRTVFSIASFPENGPRLQTVSALKFAKAVDKTAWWLRAEIGISTKVRPIGYIGPHDLRHVLLTYACVKVGYAALYLSPKNNTEGAVSVLKALSCDYFVKVKERPCLPLVGDIMRERPLKLLELPELEELLDAEFTEPYPYQKTFDEAENEPFCYLHTSGTTGVPKPIPWSNGLIGTMDAVRLLPPTDGDGGLLPWTHDWRDGDTIYSSFPMSHGAGIIMDILMPSLFNLHCVLGPADVLPNMHLIGLLADHAKIDIWSMVPSLVDELGETPDVLAKFIPSKFICASGGPVSPISAGKVNDVIRVLNLTGTTEGLFIGNLVVSRKDWLWFAFHPYSGFEFKEVEPDTYEHWVHRNEHSDLFQGIFKTFPAKESVNFKDLYMKHPTKQNLWAFKGRSDDLVVLSNGYKISPLEIEALITTHSAIHGCLVIGTGRPQAGLLIELMDPASRSEELFDSIWKIVEKANSVSRHKNQLSRDYIFFAEVDKPFIRTDKQTVKRAATLALYADNIERFYSTRDVDPGAHTIDTTSVETITQSLRSLLGSLVQAVKYASVDEDLFGLGLDSLQVFQAVNNVRAALKLNKEELAPRHLYGNSTLSKFSVLIDRLTTGKKREVGGDDVDQASSQMRHLLNQHKARMTFSLNAFDYVNPNHYMGLDFFFALQEGISFEVVFANLQEGLRRTFEIIPALDGKITRRSEHEIGYKPGDLCVTIPPLRPVPARSQALPTPRQLVFKDLSSVLPSFHALREGGFVPSSYNDDDLLGVSPFPTLPADILVAHANFVQGGCILSTNFNHCCFDGVGVIIAMKVWAEQCRFLQGDTTATCSWFDTESFNHSLPEILYEHEGYAKPAEEVDPGVWGFLPFLPPKNQLDNGIVSSNASQVDWSLPPAPSFPHRFVWPPPPVERGLSTTLFRISAENVQGLKQQVMTDTNGVITSISDIVQAFFWRSAIRSRYRVATDLHGAKFTSQDISVLELPVDGRPYFSSLLPSTYMGSMLILNRPTMPLETLVSADTSIAQVAHVLREAASNITPSLVHDAFTLLQTLPDYSRFTTACMGLEGMHAMISNLMLFQTREICFGDQFFGEGGCPMTMRPQIQRGHKRFRFLVIFPMRDDGGIELVLGTLPEELEMLQKDAEFVKYATLVNSCH
ncbi:hypothetical protein ACN47E_008056 [Coniothyrium glycines]